MNTTQQYDIRRIHREAMELADLAFAEKRNGRDESSQNLFKDSYQLEFRAAQLSQTEPSRSVLFRSAATLGLHAKLFREAEIAACLGLAGSPPVGLATELRDVLERINFDRHLELRGVILNPSEVQMTLTGNAVADGMANSDVIFERVQSFSKLVRRTADRKNNIPFRKLKSSTYYDVFLSPPRVGSFAVTLRVGEPQQLMLPNMDDSGSIIDEVIQSLDLLNEGRIDDLQNEIQDREYFQSFLGIAKTIAPDGDRIKMVGVTASRDGIERRVGLSLTSSEIKISQTTNEALEVTGKEPEAFSIVGELKYADEIKANIIKVVDSEQKAHPIKVTQAIAEDVVRPYFGKQVVVDVIRQGKHLIFQDINASNE